MKTLALIAAAGLSSTAMAQIGATADGIIDISDAVRGTSNFTYDINFDSFSFDASGAAGNAVLSVNIGAGNTITGIGWDVNIETVGASWLSEVTFRFADSSFADAGLFLSPGAGNDAPGAMNFNSGGVLDLTDNTIPNITLADGILQIEIFEGYDDVPGAIDAMVNGTLTLGLANEVPAPGAAALFGLGALGATRRRRG